MRVVVERLAIAVLVLWTGGALVAETWRAVEICSFRRPPETFAERWRVGSPDWHQLADFTRWIERMVPAGEVIAFRDQSGNKAIAWSAAYLLPRHEILPLTRARQLDDAGWAAMYRGTWTSDRLEPVLEHPHGTIYRRRR